jgi:hypothetical protein
MNLGLVINLKQKPEQVFIRIKNYSLIHLTDKPHFLFV